MHPSYLVLSVFTMKEEMQRLTEDGVGVAVCCFNPDGNHLRKLLAVIVDSGHPMVLIDDGSEDGGLQAEQALDGVEQPSIKLLRMSSNTGLAAAQNRAFSYAQEQGWKAVILFDQDSLPESGQIDTLAGAFSDLWPRDQHGFAALASYYVDSQLTSRAPFFQLKGGLRRRQQRRTGERYCDIDYCAASGTLIPLEAFERVGEFRRDLHIGYVDVEWCFRARSLGYRLLGVWDAGMHHQLGDRSVNVLGRHFPLHSPLRQYYRVRNLLLIARQPAVSLVWVGAEFMRVLLRWLLDIGIADQRWRRIRLFCRGAKHGFLGRGGIGP